MCSVGVCVPPLSQVLPEGRNCVQVSFVSGTFVFQPMEGWKEGREKRGRKERKTVEMKERKEEGRESGKEGGRKERKKR